MNYINPENVNKTPYIHHLPGLLNTAALNTIHQLLKNTPFIDGKATATDAARSVKRNLQADTNNQEIMSQLQQIIGMSLMNEPKFQTEMYASRIYPFLFSKYEKGMGYGWHVDSPMMGVPPVRTDLAMTIFLSDPAAYEGGELIIRTETGEISYKPAMGDAVIYPCQYVHCVNEVSSGTRMAAVSWIQCSVRSAEQRSLLSELKRAHNKLASKDQLAEETQAVLQVWSNLLRMWAEV
ncbi:MAG: Fe2+-dependent dioxygenase [Bacteroidia bacterium]